MDNTQATGMKKNKKKGKIKWIVIALLLLAAAAAAVFFLRGKKTKKPAQNVTVTYEKQAVERHDITSAITGSGTLEAANSYLVATHIEGNILTCSFEEGDVVTKDMVLYTLDSSDISTNLEQAQISYRQSQRSYEKKMESIEDLNVKSEHSGRVLDIAVAVGEEVKNGQVLATVRDTDYMHLKVSFPADEAANFAEGQAAVVTMDSTFETLSGTIYDISPLDTVLAGNRLVREVTIEVKNPGGLSTIQSASAAVGTSESVAPGSFAYKDEGTIVSGMNAKIKEIRCKEGDRVEKDALAFVLESEALNDEIQAAKDSFRNAEIALQSRYDQLDKYTIKSPISGTVVDKFYKAGETTEANKTLCSIYDLSYLVMTLGVDELDISNITAGQEVELTAEAVGGKKYQGVVTKVSVAGTSSNGVATYPVTIRIDEGEGLRPGMTVDATIVLNSASDVLAIPAAALQRGNTVLVTKDSPSAANGTKPRDEAAAEEFVSVEVTIGASDDEFIEITSGLQEGDQVGIRVRNRNNQQGGMNFMGMMGGGNNRNNNRNFNRNNNRNNNRNTRSGGSRS
ncbi:MAG: HlyD family efflux transporter periplasmic adaptor subunit [Oscillospiraceae bacterium]|nr:HlyD family efflux transporter periplasmic adaptor subunit [Oscillospiraceae bacterium]